MPRPLRPSGPPRGTRGKKLFGPWLFPARRDPETLPGRLALVRSPGTEEQLEGRVQADPCPEGVQAVPGRVPSRLGSLIGPERHGPPRPGRREAGGGASGWSFPRGLRTHVVNGRGKPRSPNLRLDLRRPKLRCSGRPSSAGQSAPLSPLPPAARVPETQRPGAPSCTWRTRPLSRSILDPAGLRSPVLGPGPRATMSFLSRQQPPPPRRAGAACTLRQKLIFSPCSDFEEEEEEEEEEGSGHSTGEDSAFQEPDSPLPPARSPMEPGPERRRSPGPAPGSPGELEEDLLLPGACRGADEAGGGTEGDSWEEEGFGSSSPVKSPAAPYFLGNSFSPVLCGGPGDASPRSCGARQGPCSPRPDHPGTPPHKTFRKLRLFDTPHTPKVSAAGAGTQRPGPSRARRARVRLHKRRTAPPLAFLRRPPKLAALVFSSAPRLSVAENLLPLESGPPGACQSRVRRQ
ncbi:hypothetical protein P7K49_022097 [Saguinus oedipus]|uniref:Uncharacterized protein n=1 Tax=Saguinus oedipus TaxID=9490 RepID=A0ABQ9UVD1_SAGOE|nr:hypothetical protein P7K49_022097 [Saguinus oedipus]